MREVKLNITPFRFIDLLECTIYKEVNQHFTAKLVGHLAPTEDDECVQRCPKEQPVCIQAIDMEGDTKILFKGIVRKIKVNNVGNLRKLTVHAVSRSWLLDVQEHTRSFQHEQQTYQDVIEFIKQNYQAAFVYPRGIDEKTNEILVQYEETDWNFIKRIASHLSSVIVADTENDNITVSFGVPKKTTAYHAESPMYAIEKNIEEYIDKTMYQVDGFAERDAIAYTLGEREIWELCAPVTFLGNQLYVYKIVSHYDGKELVHTYDLHTKDGFKTKRQNNNKLAGNSLIGKIIDVTNNLVKIHLDVDPEQSLPKAKWFVYSTVYSHPNGPGWYCMPEIDDAAWLHFPNEGEQNGYVSSAVHLDNANQRRIDPNIKTLCTIFDKEIEFTPETLKITNNHGLSILLDDRQGIQMCSNKDIHLHSAQNIRISGDKTVEIHGQMGVDLKQRQNRINIAGDIKEWSEGVYHK